MDAREAMPVTEILEFLNSRRGLLDAVCISGGEPTAHEGITDFARTAKKLGYLVKIDTNGSYPRRLKELVESAGIDYVAMDIKNAANKYAATIGMAEYDTAQVEESIEYLLGGRVEYEFRTTVVRGLHTIDDLLSIAGELISGAGKYFLQGFENPEKALRAGLSAYSEKEMREMCQRVKEVLPCTSLRGGG